MCRECNAESGRATPSATAATPRSHALDAAAREAGKSLLRRHPSVDVHSHPGRFFMIGADDRTAFMDQHPPGEPQQAVGDMHAGGVSAVLFATVADNRLLEQGERGLRAVREFRAGEAHQDHRRQMHVLQSIVRDNAVLQGRDVADIYAAHACQETACMFSVEGGDFIEDRLERVAAAHREGVRSITVIHYHTNQIGDTQTESPVHRGLTPLGRDIIRAMQSAGIIVDLAHASLAATRQAADVAARPMMISHSNLRVHADDHPRCISLEHARLVTQSGGLVGAVPAGFGQATFGDYIDTILHMVDALGAAHVAIGTDMDFTYRPVFSSYRDWDLIPAALLARGMNEEEVAGVIGGNFIRLLAAAGTPAVA